MNLRKKITGFALGLALMLGAGGVFAANGILKEAVGVNAKAEMDSETGYYADSFAAGKYVDSTIIWSLDDENITMTQFKGSSATSPNPNYVNAARVYMGNYLRFVAINNYKIHKIEITYDGTYYGYSMTAGTTLDGEGTKVIDDTASVSRTWGTTSGGTHIVSSISSQGLSTVYVQSTYTKSGGKQLRWQSGGVKVFYSKPAATGEITGVKINGSDSPVTEKITEGYLGRKTFQLTGEAIQSGSGLDSSVSWSSADNDKMTVSATGLVTVLANDTVRITATSNANNSFSNHVDITAEGLLVFDGVETSTKFDTGDMGETKIVSTKSGEPADVSGALSVAKLTVDKADSSSDPGYYVSNPVTLRVYGGATMTVTVPETYKLFWIDLTSVSGNELTESNTKVSTGTLSISDLHSTVDCVSQDANTVVFTMSAQVRLTGIFVFYGKKANSEALNDAIAYAQLFNENIGCDSKGQIAPSGWETVKEAWSDGTITTDAQSILTNVDLATETDTDIKKCIETYEYIVSKYNGLDSDKYNDFMGRGVQITSASKMINKTVDNNTEALAIAFLFVAGITLVGSYFFLRRKRYN